MEVLFLASGLPMTTVLTGQIMLTGRLALDAPIAILMCYPGIPMIGAKKKYNRMYT